MALKTSTGLRNGVLSGGSLKSRLDGGRINIYAGTPPAPGTLTGTGWIGNSVNPACAMPC